MAKAKPGPKKKKKIVKGADAISEKQIAEAQEPEIKDINEIYKDGCLLNLKVGVWSARTTFDSNLIKDEFTLEEKKLISSKNKVIADDSLLKEIDLIGFSCRVEIEKWSIDFPVRGLRFVRKVHIIRLNEFLKERQKLFYEKVNLFTEKLFEKGGIIDQFKESHPKLYEEAVKRNAYPDQYSLQNKFHFTWTWRQLSLPDLNGNVFSAEMMEEEIEKAKAQISEMKAMTMQVVRETFLKRIKTLQEQCEGDKVNKRTLNAWEDWLKKFDELWSDFVWRPDLSKVINEVRSTMGKVEADTLKENEKFRNQIGKELGKAVKEIQNLPEIKAKRAFDL